MCRVCGRMVKCIFDTMPSRTIARCSPSRFIATSSRSISSAPPRQTSSKLRIQITPRASGLGARSIQLPFRSRPLHTTARQDNQLESTVLSTPFNADIAPSFLETPAQSTPPTLSPAEPAVSERPLVLSKSLQQLLPVLAAQTPHYISAHIHSFPYLLTTGDTLRLPFHLHGVSPGDILRFNRATILGSREYTLKAAALPQQLAATQSTGSADVKHVRGEFQNGKRSGEPSYIDDRLYECRVRVMSLDSGPMMVTEKKKRRNRRMKKVMSKHKYTVVKVMEVKAKTLEEVMEQEKGQVILE
ncbi:hypothetical protein H2198_001050 [Neophaeococcomyces mojaviensis]|uniref:Uncharacterized protein n=1 Tax=Neophaeococcomyces mojaviensis TaxID=3383035 RepID=A0ACC3AI77_9EURO|nr:hypothetical protein H2198_001050 [Knufia sp. JES_112]